MVKTRVFVYGTLKQGFYNHRVMQHAGGTFVGEDTTKGQMYSRGAFPMVDISKDGRILGEIYELEEENLKILDRLEGYPTFYNRSQIDTGHGRVWIYHVEREKYPQLPIIETGVWK